MCGVVDRLRGMGTDADLNVREKVRDFFEQGGEAGVLA